jgi:hypothetical protein
MTTKKFILSCLVLLAFAWGGYIVYDAKYDAAYGVAHKAARPYVPLSDEDAIAEAFAECQNDPELLALSFRACDTIYENPSPKLLKAAHESHSLAFDRAEIFPRVHELQDQYLTYFERFLVFLGLTATAVFLLWCRSTLLPLAVKFHAKLRARSSLSTGIETFSATRQVRQAESDFATLKNLHDNGLIDDEMFHLRKEELRLALTANKVFQSKEETPTT